MTTMTGISKFKRFEFRVAKVVVLTCLLALAIISISVTVVENNLAKKRLVNDISVISQIVANRSIAALIFFDNQAAEVNLSVGRFHNSIEMFCLYDGNGDFFSHYTKQGLVASCEERFDKMDLALIEHEFDTAKLIVRVPVTDQGQSVGYLYTRSNLDYIGNVLSYLLLTNGIVVIIALILAFLLARRLLSVILAPLHHLQETAMAIIHDPFSNLRAKKESDDEVGLLVNAFNRMLDSLAQENAAALASESRFRVLAENAPIGIYAREFAKEGNPESFKTFTNRRWREITSYDNFEAVAPFVNNLPQSQQRLYHNCLEKVEHRQQAQMLEYQFICPVSQTEMTFIEYFAPLVDANTQKVTGIIGSLVDATELKNAQLELEKLAFYDPLTDLPNRRFFRDHLHFSLENARKHEHAIAVLMLDLDHFKKINDTLGHDAGDELLVKLAQCIRQAVFNEDVVSRMGGDEFMILLQDINEPSQIDKVATRIVKAMQEPIGIYSQTFDISASIGVAVYPQDASTAEELVKNADIAMYKAKENGRNQVAYFSSELDNELKEKMRIERKLKKAIAADQLEVYVQPQYDLKRGCFNWGEALVRWIDEEDGFIPPIKFITIAEETDLINQIGRAVIDKVCCLISEHGDTLAAIGINGIAINLSARQFFSSDLLDDIQSALGKYAISAKQLEFELTESLVMEDTGKAIKIMQALRDLGCRLSIDDFGTGYSSLAYLKRFPIDCVKIDRSFIMGVPNDKNDVEISSAIIAMAHKLGLETIAEGVETQEHMDFLKQQKCEYIQGYFMSRPLPIKDLLALPQSQK
ncbi:hypothetical protein C2869_19890 [Saccharobesus litoralis]|uniref:Uncharacterized protein n=1 Tax=Saccharobesus litoralis TaxID=2172099 RepID=A0A2S0VWH3_9ALTE|nr:EAL domain-containing protein [Saccharobesus litoralis]AWB68522.1 hypothetical protein C2869_19890 [Saccharobesus litoralis]